MERPPHARLLFSFLDWSLFTKKKPVTLFVYRIKPITANLSPSSFIASSWLNDYTAPHFAQLYPNGNRYWKPAKSSENEYLEVNLHKPETIYGIEISGSPLNDEYVTSYKLAYSMDGVSFSIVLFHGLPEVIIIARSQNYRSWYIFVMISVRV